MNQISPIVTHVSSQLDLDVAEEPPAPSGNSIPSQKQLLKTRKENDFRKLRRNRLKQFLCHDSSNGRGARSQAFNASFFRFLMQSQPKEILSKIESYTDKSVHEKVQLCASIEVFLPFIPDGISKEITAKVDELVSVVDITNEIRMSTTNTQSMSTEKPILCFEFGDVNSLSFLEDSLNLLSVELVGRINPKSFLQGYIKNCELDLDKIRVSNLACELELETAISKFNSAIWLGAVFDGFGYENQQINSSQLFIRKGIVSGAVEDISFILPLTRPMVGTRTDKYELLSYLTLLSPSCLFPDYDGDSSQIQTDTCLFLKGMC